MQTEGADFVMRDTRLLWTEKAGGPLAPLLPEVLSEAIGEETPDTAFVKALRGSESMASPPETVRPVLNFTLAALEAAEAGGDYVIMKSIT